MSTPEFTLNPDLADELKSLSRDKQHSSGPVVLDATAERDRGTPERTSPQFVREGVPRSLDHASPVLSAIERFPGPVILASSGSLDAVDLALCCACTVSYVHSETELGEIEPAAALRLGLAGRLTERLGPGAATGILLGATTAAPGLAVTVPDPLAAARATAARLAEPAAALLPRSLAFAARGTRAQSAAYDSELLALLTDRKRGRDDPSSDA
jgi:enoyl-CoA hydratase/carnithine racemase